MMGALLPILLPLLPGIIQGVEQLFRAKKGKEKREVAVEMASVAVKKAREMGAFDGNEGAQEVAALVEVIFQHMKASGQLQEAKEGEAVAPAATQRVIFEGTLRQANA